VPVKGLIKKGYNKGGEKRKSTSKKKKKRGLSTNTTGKGKDVLEEKRYDEKKRNWGQEGGVERGGIARCKRTTKEGKKGTTDTRKNKSSSRR